MDVVQRDADYYGYIVVGAHPGERPCRVSGRLDDQNAFFVLLRNTYIISNLTNMNPVGQILNNCEEQMLTLSYLNTFKIRFSIVFFSFLFW